MRSVNSLLHTQQFSDSCRTVEAGSPVSQGPFFKGSLALVISQGLKVSVPGASVCAPGKKSAWEELWLLKAESLFKCKEQNCQVCLKEDKLREHEK